MSEVVQEFRESLAEGNAQGGARQERIMNFLRYYMGKHRGSPSLQEIGEAVGLTSRASVWAHIRTLERKGLIRTIGKRSRNIELVEREQTWNYEDFTFPLEGYIARRYQRVSYIPQLALSESDPSNTVAIGAMLDRLKETSDVIVAPVVNIKAAYISTFKRRGFFPEHHHSTAIGDSFDAWVWRRPEEGQEEENLA